MCWTSLSLPAIPPTRLSAGTGTAAVFIGSTVVGATPPLPASISGERRVYFLSKDCSFFFFWFFCFGSRSVLLPPGCRCATRIDIDATVRAARKQVLTPRAHCVCVDRHRLCQWPFHLYEYQVGEWREPNLKTLPCLHNTTGT